MSVQFPNWYSKPMFVVLLVGIYLIYCIPESSMNSDLWWKVQTYTDYVLIYSISYVGCIEAKSKLVKSMFFALIIDSIFSVLNVAFFGDNYNFYSSLSRNGSIIISFIYGFLILFKNND